MGIWPGLSRCRAAWKVFLALFSSPDPKSHLESHGIPKTLWTGGGSPLEFLEHNSFHSGAGLSISFPNSSQFPGQETPPGLHIPCWKGEERGTKGGSSRNPPRGCPEQLLGASSHGILWNSAVIWAWISIPVAFKKGNKSYLKGK